MTIQLLRGRVILEPIDDVQSDTIIIPDTFDQDGRRKGRYDGHRGRVVAMGAPALTQRVYYEGSWHGGIEVAPDFKVGDEVVYVRATTHHKTTGWGDYEGRKAVYVAQEEIIAVIE